MDLLVSCDNDDSYSKKMEAALAIGDYALEKRRDKLRQLLVDEDECYRQMAADTHETTEHRVQAMKERIAELRERKEAARLKFVQKKEMELFSLQSDELRIRRSEALTRLVQYYTF